MKNIKLIIFAFLCILFSNVVLNATTNVIDITGYNHTGKIDWSATNAGGFVTKKIVENRVDTSKGIVPIELKFTNSKETEIVFVLDNGSVNTQKAHIIDGLDTFIDNMFNIGLAKTKIRFMQVHPYDATTTTLVDNVTDFSANESALKENILAYQNTNAVAGQDFVSSINKSKTLFSETSENKIIVLILNGYDTTTANIATYKAAIEGIENTYTLLTVLIGDDANATDPIFGTQAIPTKGTFKIVNADALDSDISSTVMNVISSVIPKAKTNVIITDVFTDNILKAFDVNLAYSSASQGTVSAFDKTNKQFTWTIPTLAYNQDATYTFSLKIKNSIDKDLINIPLNTNEGVKVSFTPANGERHEGNLTDCSPSVKVLVQNPKTGVIDVVVPIMVTVMVCSLGYYIVAKQKRFA